ncbi:MAG: hypothetical protein PHH77_03215 [Victivallaceae bacterium]|nr:hypothetical protein [Victivallaceae bacterium]
MNKTKFTCTIIFTLLTGVIIGALLTCLLMKPGHETSNFERHHARILRKIVKKLDLNERQEQQFYTIHEKRLADLCAIMQTVKPRMLQMILEEKNEIAAILTPEQQAKFAKIREKQINKFKSRFANIEYLKSSFPAQRK